MASFFSPKHRSVVPRWRLFAATAATGDLAWSGPGSVNSIIITADAQEKDWREFHTVWHATDFLSASVVSNRTGDAQDAARFLLENPSDVSVSALSLARSIAPGGTSEQGDFDENWAEVVRRLRTSLATDPRSAMQWSDLALAHTVLGNRRNALRSMNVAISLAPDNRFVLRTAARCFQHWGEPDRAHALLRSSAATLREPWLLSAEVAIASARQRPPTFFAAGRSMVKDRSFSSRDVSELACGLGSIEFEAGAKRHARPLLVSALKEPTENSVAQVEWLFSKDNRQFPGGGLEQFQTPMLFEATAVENYVKGEWVEALASAKQWLEFQPFSSRPAELGSYAASLIGQFNDAVDMLASVRASNPDDQMVFNNLAYFSAMGGKLEDGKRWLEKVNWTELDADQLPILTATAGLLKFREGDVEGGRAMYGRAVLQAQKTDGPRVEAVALINLSREEMLAGNNSEASAKLSKARKLAKRAQGADLQTMLARVEASFSEQGLIVRDSG